jgi:hypothetical protein
MTDSNTTPKVRLISAAVPAAVAGARGEAQPAAVPEVLPKGTAWRGWLWTTLLVALGIALVARN